MIYVEKGKFKMSLINKKIEFENGYFIGKYLVTVPFYKYIMENSKTFFSDKSIMIWMDFMYTPNGFLELLNKELSLKYPEI